MTEPAYDYLFLQHDSRTGKWLEDESAPHCPSGARELDGLDTRRVLAQLVEWGWEPLSTATGTWGEAQILARRVRPVKITAQPVNVMVSIDVDRPAGKPVPRIEGAPPGFQELVDYMAGPPERPPTADEVRARWGGAQPGDFVCYGDDRRPWKVKSLHLPGDEEWDFEPRVQIRNATDQRWEHCRALRRLRVPHLILGERVRLSGTPHVGFIEGLDRANPQGPLARVIWDGGTRPDGNVYLWDLESVSLPEPHQLPPGTLVQPRREALGVDVGVVMELLAPTDNNVFVYWSGMRKAEEVPASVLVPTDPRAVMDHLGALRRVLAQILDLGKSPDGATLAGERTREEVLRAAAALVATQTLRACPTWDGPRSSGYGADFWPDESRRGTRG